MLIGQEERSRFLEAVTEAERSPDTKGMVLVMYLARKDKPHEFRCVATGAIDKMRSVENIAFNLMDALYGRDDDGGSDA